MMSVKVHMLSSGREEGKEGKEDVNCLYRGSNAEFRKGKMREMKGT